MTPESGAAAALCHRTPNGPPALARRHFLNRTSLGLGALGLASLLNERLFAADTGGLPGVPHFAPKAKRVIYLFQSGAPSQLDLFDPKPKLDGLRATRCTCMTCTRRCCTARALTTRG
ncbi:MAG: DUF1501 domain-containing protein [Verrucomicrobia bacterium]|nr:DUF1501 domain-containing protein [Verrucomicrobiota bacterium]